MEKVYISFSQQSTGSGNKQIGQSPCDCFQVAETAFYLIRLVFFCCKLLHAQAYTAPDMLRRNIERNRKRRMWSM